MSDKEKKKGEDGSTKMWRSQEWAKLIRWDKKHFS